MVNAFQKRLIATGIFILFMSVGSSLKAEQEPTLVPIPDEISNLATPTPIVSAPVQATCRKSTLAEVYTVKDLTQCGQRLDNSGLGGLFNRGRRCAEEKTLAEVFAHPCTCEDCASKNKVAKIRCERGNDCRCENETYVKSLVTDLMENSQRVRNAATKSLRKCGFRVDHTRACVDAEVPSAILY